MSLRSRAAQHDSDFDSASSGDEVDERDSDEDLPRARLPPNAQRDSKTGDGKNKIWANVLEENKLTDSLTKSVDPGKNKMNMVNRAAESYEAPTGGFGRAHLHKNFRAPDSKSSDVAMDDDAATAPASSQSSMESTTTSAVPHQQAAAAFVDDPFGDAPVDLDSVETMGNSVNKRKRTLPDADRDWQAEDSKRAQYNDRSAGRGGGHNNQRGGNRGGGGGRGGRGGPRGGRGGRGGGRGGGAPHQQPQRPPPTLQPIIADVSLDPCSSADLLAQQLIHVLREQSHQKDLFKRLIEVIGPNNAVDLYEKTCKVEADGGLMIVNGSRRRTPGGVYLFLLKAEPYATKEALDKIFEEVKAADRRFAKARRNANPQHNFKGEIDVLKKMMHKSKEKEQLPATESTGDLREKLTQKTEQASASQSDSASTSGNAECNNNNNDMESLDDSLVERVDEILYGEADADDSHDTSK